MCYYNIGAMLALVDPGPDNKKADGVVDEVLRFSLQNPELVEETLFAIENSSENV